MITAEEVRAKFPYPLRYNEVMPALKAGGCRDDCYCVAGALLLSCGAKPDEEAEADLDDEVRFPVEFGHALIDQNPKLLASFPPPPAHDWAKGNSDISGVYASAIQGANDFMTLTPCGGEPIEIHDHFELAWQLLDDALNYDPAAHTPEQDLRLTTGCLLKVSNDADYYARLELFHYYQRLTDHYQALTNRPT